MKFAIDPYTRKIISPEDASSYVEYLCPQCKKTVTVRSNHSYSEKKPYFAHLKWKADINCENYFPSTYDPINTTTSHAVPFFAPLIPKDLPTKQVQKINATPPNFYLIVEDDIWNLYLLIELHGAPSNWGGRITIKELKGERNFYSYNIFGKHRFQVDFNFNELAIVKNGEVDEQIWNFFSSEIPQINSPLQFFHAPYSTGRLLKNHETLRIGETYIVTSNVPLEHLAPFSDFISHIKSIHSKYCYQISIDKEISDDVKKKFEEFFGVVITQARVGIELIDPLPEFIDIDGTINVSKSSEQWVIRFDCKPSELTWVLIDGVSHIDTVKINENILLVNANHIRGIELFWSKSSMLRIERVFTKPIKIPGVEISIAGYQFNLIDSHLKDEFLIDREFILDSKLLDILNITKISQGFNQLSRLNHGGSYTVAHRLEIDAGSFGYITFLNPIKDVLLKEEVINSEFIHSPKKKWLKSVSLLPLGYTSKNFNKNGLYGCSDSLSIGNSHLRANSKSQK